jgi:hypothetical protein
MEAIFYSETSVLTRATGYNVPEGIVFRHYIMMFLTCNLKDLSSNLYGDCPDVFTESTERWENIKVVHDHFLLHPLP